MPTMTRDQKTPATETAARQAWISVLAKADSARLMQLYDGLSDIPDYDIVRPAETGLVMVRGRAGGTGSPFNMGEMTVTRCVVRLRNKGGASPVGHAYCADRDRKAAEARAVLDAMLQLGEERPRIEAEVIDPLRRERDEAAQERARKVAATKVDFFTMVRGENG